MVDPARATFRTWVENRHLNPTVSTISVLTLLQTGLPGWGRTEADGACNTGLVVRN
jgi:hypothetical protein